MFDESMQVITEESGALQVQQANAWGDLSKPLFDINRNGYIYVYSLNASGISVRTDNLFVAHYQGSLLEEFNYYPFGLCFEVSRSPLLGKAAEQKYNSQFIQQDEFEDANGQTYGLEDYDFAFRNYDPQIGRWLQPDPLMQHASPYLAMSNNPVMFTDPTGLEDGVDDWIGISVNGDIRYGSMGDGNVLRYSMLTRNANGNFYSEEISYKDFIGLFQFSYFSEKRSFADKYLFQNDAFAERAYIESRAQELIDGHRQDKRGNSTTVDAQFSNSRIFNYADGTFTPRSEALTPVYPMLAVMPFRPTKVGITAISSILAKGITTKTGANLSSNGVKLAKQLASESQMAEKGLTIIGPGKLNEATRLAQQYGGNIGDWVKKSSSSFTKNGTTFETHWYENISTGLRTELKTKLP